MNYTTKKKVCEEFCVPRKLQDQYFITSKKALWFFAPYEDLLTTRRTGGITSMMWMILSMKE